MGRKSKLSSPKPPPTRTKRTASSPRRPGTKEQRAALKKLIAEQGVRPIEDFDTFLEELSGIWPKEENRDEFLTWLRKLRHGETM